MSSPGLPSLLAGKRQLQWEQRDTITLLSVFVCTCVCAPVPLGLKEPGLAAGRDDHTHSQVQQARAEHTHPAGGLDGGQLVQVHGGKLDPLRAQLLTHLADHHQLRPALEGVGPVLDEPQHTLLDDGGRVAL